MSTQFKVKLTNNEAVAPKRASENAVGYDLCTWYPFTISPGETQIIKLGQQWEFSAGVCARICPRSSLAIKGIHTVAGVVDPDYRGDIGVVLENRSDKEYIFAQGERIAQVIFQLVATPEVQIVNELSKTVRGEGGFGSTGK